MIRKLRRAAFGLLKWAIYGNWPSRQAFTPGYTILLPIPSDMPFLLDIALEGLKQLSIPNCMSVLVVPDGAASDKDLRALVARHGDKRVKFIPLKPIDRILVNLPRTDGSANFRHFSQILRGVEESTTEAIYLHDADAFWLDPGGIELQYRELTERDMYTLGVTARIDKVYQERGYQIPGTWELMFSNRWVRQRPPSSIKGGWYPVPDEGQWRWFDTLLSDQYINYKSGKFGVMAQPPRFVHFYATITEYRSWMRSDAASFEDKLFSLLLLSVLAYSMRGGSSRFSLPRPDELILGVGDDNAEITYMQDSTVRRYPGFRRSLEELRCSSGNDEVKSRILEAIKPFDDHFKWRASAV